MDGLPLHKAILDGNVEAARTWIEAGANIDEKDDVSSDTPLHVAISTRNIEILKLLIEAKANVNEKHAIFKETPLDLALHDNVKEIVEALTQAGAKVNIKSNNDWTELQYSLDECKLYLEKISIDAQNVINSQITIDGKTELHLAVEKNDVKTIEDLLFRQGVDVNEKENIKKFTPLHSAVIHNKGKSHLDAIKILLENKADLDAQDDKGMTPIHYLNRDRQVNDEVLELIFNYMVDDSCVKNNQDKTFLKKGQNDLKQEGKEYEKQNQDYFQDQREEKNTEKKSYKFLNIDLKENIKFKVKKCRKQSIKSRKHADIQRWQKLEENIDEIKQSIEDKILSRLKAINTNNKIFFTVALHFLLLTIILFGFVIQFCLFE